MRNRVLEALDQTDDVYPWAIRSGLADMAVSHAAGRSEVRLVRTAVTWLRSHGHLPRQTQQRFRVMPVTVLSIDRDAAAACPEYDPDGP